MTEKDPWYRYPTRTADPWYLFKTELMKEWEAGRYPDSKFNVGETVEIDLEQYAPARQVLLHGKVTVCEKDYCDVKKQWIYHVENEWGYKCYFYEDELEKVY